MKPSLVVLLILLAGACGSNTAPSSSTTSSTTPPTTTGSGGSTLNPALVPPGIVAPVGTAVQPAKPTFIFTNAPHPDGVTSLKYRIEFASDAAFATFLSGGQDIPENTTSATTQADLTGDFPLGNYFWRVRESLNPVTDPVTGAPIAVASAFSDVHGFRLQATINIPTLVSPLAGTATTPGTPFVVGNSSHIGAVGGLTYTFQIRAGATVVASATVPEGSGQTSWTPPPVPAGAYSWTAFVTDSLSGTSSHGASASFVVAPSTDAIYTVEFDDRGAHGCEATPPTVARTVRLTAALLDAPGAAHERFVVPSTMVIDLNNAGTVTAVVTGGAVVSGILLTLSTDSKSDQPLTLTGHADSPTSFSGTFTGFLRSASTFDGTAVTTACDNGWRIHR